MTIYRGFPVTASVLLRFPALLASLMGIDQRRRQRIQRGRAACSTLSAASPLPCASGLARTHLDVITQDHPSRCRPGGGSSYAYAWPGRRCICIWRHTARHAGRAAGDRRRLLGTPGRSPVFGTCGGTTPPPAPGWGNAMPASGIDRGRTNHYAGFTRQCTRWSSHCCSPA